MERGAAEQLPTKEMFARLPSRNNAPGNEGTTAKRQGASCRRCETYRSASRILCGKLSAPRSTICLKFLCISTEDHGQGVIPSSTASVMAQKGLRHSARRRSTSTMASFMSLVHLSMVVILMTTIRLVPILADSRGEWQHPLTRPRHNVPWVECPTVRDRRHDEETKGGRLSGEDGRDVKGKRRRAREKGGRGLSTNGWPETRRSDSMRDVIEVSWWNYGRRSKWRVQGPGAGELLLANP